MRVSRILIMCLIGCALAAPAAAQQKLKLPIGVEVAVTNAQESQLEDGRKAMKVFLAVSNVTAYNETERSIIADTFFELFLGPYVEENDFRVAEVALAKSMPLEGMGSGMFTTAEFYKYERAENGVWKPGHDSKLDDEEQPAPKTVTLPSGAVIHVEYQGEAYVSVVQGNSYIGAYWSDTPLSDIPQLYMRTREYWQTLKEAVPASVKTAHVVAYDTPKRGYFHFRDAFAIGLSRQQNGSWPSLPETWGDVKKGPGGPIQASFRADRVKTIWPDW